MSFVGEVGQISLLNIYQALSLNQQGGILVVVSGNEKRKIRFVQNGIRLLSSEADDPDPLRQMLVKLKVLTESQINNVIATKNDDRSSLGDFLIQRRVIDEEVVARGIAKQSLELIFETFFWRPAKYEFNACDEGDESELFSQDGAGACLTFRIEKVLMEVARREDEWTRIHESIPEKKEIFTPKNPTEFLSERGYESELSPGEIKEIKQLLDGQKTVEQIANETRLTKYEAYRTITVFMLENEIRPLEPQEKKTLAEELRKKFKFREAIDIYNQLLVYDREDTGTRRNLIEVLEKNRHNDAALVGHYLYVAQHAIDHNDLAEARKYLDKAVAIDPHNLDVREKLFDALSRTSKERETLSEARAIVESVKVTKEYSNGSRILEKIINRFPNDSSFYHECADFHQFDGNAQEAVRNLKAVGVIYEKLPDYTRLRKTYERIASIDPTESQALKRYQDLERKTTTSLWKRVAPSLFSAAAVAAGFLFAYIVVIDVLCRRAYASVVDQVDTLVDNGSYDEAVVILDNLHKNYPVTTLRWRLATRLEEISEFKRKAIRDKQVESEEKNTRFTSYLAQVTTLLRDREYSSAWNKVKAFDHEGLNEKNLRKLHEIERGIEKVFAQSQSLRRRAEALTQKGSHQDAHPMFIELLMKYPSTPATRNLDIPLVIRTVPPDAELHFNGRSVGKTPLVVRYNPFRKFRLRVIKPGFEEFVCGENEKIPTCIEFSRDWSLTVPLKRVPTWTKSSTDTFGGEPVFDTKSVFVTTRMGDIVRLDRTNGDVAWSSRERKWLFSSGVRIRKQRLYFGTDDGAFIVLDKNSGDGLAEMTPFRDRSPLFCSDATPNGFVGVVAGPNVAALNLEDSAILWTASFKGVLPQPPASYRNTLVVCSSDGKIRLLDLFSGVLKGFIDLKKGVQNPGTIAGNSYFIADERGMIYRVDLDTRDVDWGYRCERNDLRIPRVVGDSVIVSSRVGYLLALDSASGSRKWEHQVDEEFSAPAPISPGRFVLGTQKGLLLCLDASTGKFCWTFKADGGLMSRPAPATNGLFVVSDQGTVYSFMPE